MVFAVTVCATVLYGNHSLGVFGHNGILFCSKDIAYLWNLAGIATLLVQPLVSENAYARRVDPV